MRKRPVILFLLLHIAAGIGVILFPCYRAITARIFAVFPSCPMHDFFHIYCPFCGGTRAVDELLHFRFIPAMRCHPVVVLFLGLVLVWDVLAWVRLIRGRNPWSVPVPRPLALTVAGVFVGYWILRNVLLIGFGVDPLGDLARFYVR